MTIRTLSLDDHPRGVGLRETTLAWIHEAGNPYFDWFLGTPERARAVITRWFGHPAAEIAAARVRLVQEEGRDLGGFIALDGKALRKARRADATMLLPAFPKEERADLLTRLKASDALFRAPDDDEYYLSKMGVLPAARGRGCGKVVLAAYLAAGTAAGHRRFSLDVAADNIAAQRLYENDGFRTVAETSIPATPIRYVSMLKELE